jgi:hypothetical protein
MATIHVARDGVKLGEFSLEQVREGLATGQFRATDLGWQSGMADWRLLGEFAVERATAAAPSADASVISPLPGTGPMPETGLPWEHRQQLGFFKAFFDTVSVLLMKPGEAFVMMKREGGMTDPLLFAMIGGSAGTIASTLFQIGLQSIPGIGGSNNIVAVFGMGVVVGFLILTPLLMAAGMFIGSAILHLCLMLLGGANKPFEATFRVVCFSCGAAYLLSIIPFCGGYITPIYNIVLECIGISRAHETTMGKAVLAVLLPLIVCCGIIAVVMGIVVAGSGGDLLKSLRP